MKQAFRLSCLALLMSSSLLLARTPLPPIFEGNYLTMFPTKWHMVDALVNKQIKAKVGWGLESRDSKLKHAGILALPLLAKFAIAHFNIVPKHWHNYIMTSVYNGFKIVPGILRPRPENDGKVIMGSSAVLLALAYNFYHRWNHTEHEEQELIELLMSRWQELRPYFPEELYQPFDAVYQLREDASPDYNVNATKMLRIAQDLASKHVKEHKNKGETGYIMPYIRPIMGLISPITTLFSR